MTRAERAALLGALAAHAGFLALHRLVPEQTRLPAGEELVAVELIVADPVKENPLDARIDGVPQGAMDRRASSAPVSRGSRASAPGAVLRTEGDGGEDVVPVPTGSAKPDGSGEQWSQLPSRKGPILEGAVLHDPLAMLPRDPGPKPAPTAVAQAPVKRDIGNDVINKSIDGSKGIKTLSLPAAGNVNTAVEVAVIQNSTINEGSAVVVVTLGPGGRVLDVKVPSYSGGSQENWKAVEAAVRAQLNGQKLALNSQHEKGAIVRIRVTSSMELPAGGKDSWKFKGPGIEFDPNNIGAKPRRKVHGTIQSITPVK